MDLLVTPPPIDLNDRSWIVHTRTEERPPVWISSGAKIMDSMVADGCEIFPGAIIERSVLSPGVRIGPDAVIREAVILTDSVIERGAIVERAILEKKTHIGERARVGAILPSVEPLIPMIGKNSYVPLDMVIEPGAVIGTDVIESDYPDPKRVRSSDYVETKRKPYEV
jgi:glucose-1-phosphate adenylyltransferase